MLGIFLEKRTPGKEGALIAIEETDVPFEIKRVFYVFDLSETAVRGDHANLNLDEIVMAVKGSCDIVLNDGKKIETYHLDNPGKFLHIGPKVWIDIKNFEKDSVLLVLCSKPYHETIVVRNYDEFLSLI